MYFDWTQISDDPNNSEGKRRAAETLSAIRHLHLDTDDLRYVEGRCRGKRVLDIGIASHAERYIDLENFRHTRIAKVAKYCLGIDILEHLVQRLANDGYNVRVADATSNEYLGEQFDLVFVGDVVEHVNDAVALLKYCGRHIGSDGSILVLTPNPFSRKFFRQLHRKGDMIVNLDHVSWVSQTNALELARRSGLELKAVHLVKRLGRVKTAFKRLYWRLGWEAIEYTFPVYIYEFGHRNNEARKRI